MVASCQLLTPLTKKTAFFLGSQNQQHHGNPRFLYLNMGLFHPYLRGSEKPNHFFDGSGVQGQLLKQREIHGFFPMLQLCFLVEGTCHCFFSICSMSPTKSPNCFYKTGHHLQISGSRWTHLLVINEVLSTNKWPYQWITGVFKPL